VLAYEMVTGHLPFQANDALALAVMHAHDPIPPLPSNRRHWQPFISLAMAKTKEQRFRNAEQMLSALDELERRHRLGPGVDATPEPAATPPGRTNGESPSTLRPAGRWLGVGAAALVIAAGAAWWMASRDQATDFLTIDGSAPTVVDDPIGSVAIAAGAAPAPAGADAAMPPTAPLAEATPADRADNAPTPTASAAFVSQALP
jgi:hypothetical protein